MPELGLEILKVVDNKKRRRSFFEAETVISEYNASPRPAGIMKPLVIESAMSMASINEKIRALSALSPDDYVKRTVMPSEDPRRRSACDIIAEMSCRVVDAISKGPLYIAEVEFDADDKPWRAVILAQNRSVQNGVWMPEHHRLASKWITHFVGHKMPIITFIDTPGADAGEVANMGNQAHSISELIMTMGNAHVPSVGIILGNGYSGGAIPLATTNILLSVRDAVFNTIHPQALSEIVHRYNLSWQECARYVGISAYELCKRGIVDAVIDYSPVERGSIAKLEQAIVETLVGLENRAANFLREPDNDYLFLDYVHSLRNVLNPTDLLIDAGRKEGRHLWAVGNVVGSVFRYHRYLNLRRRLNSTSLARISRLSKVDIPEGGLADRRRREREERFKSWLDNPLEIRYDTELLKGTKRLIDTRNAINSERKSITSIFLMSPEKRMKKTARLLTMQVGLYLYNFWKSDARANFVQLLRYIEQQPVQQKINIESASIIDVLLLPEIRQRFSGQVLNFVLFDLIYDHLIANMHFIAAELKENNEISYSSMKSLLEHVVDKADEHYRGNEDDNVDLSESWEKFFQWLETLLKHRDIKQIMRQIGGWKRLAHPRISEPLFGLITCYFTDLLPSYYDSQADSKNFKGKINPSNIGIKDFWNRLAQTYSDLLIYNLITDYKRKKTITPQDVIGEVFEDFKEIDPDIVTADPLRFPGYRSSIERALKNNIRPVGVITGFATFKFGRRKNRVGVMVSNSGFQSGAFDMASGVKLCRLLLECANAGLPLVMFTSSGGMQTKEGPGALFSMAVINTRITRFIRDFDLPIISFGFRDCTGGSQASFVTHPMVKSFYLSGSLIPFAGQRVVPNYLPMQSILANYLSENDGSMDGLVKNPFDRGLDKKLCEIDPSIPIPSKSISQAIAEVLAGGYKPSVSQVKRKPLFRGEEMKLKPINRVLIHSRGATAARIIQAAQAMGKQVILVQSDADMTSYPASLLGEDDRLICLGGNTSQESYLNGMSVVRIALQENADAIHPGIGFLSENPDYAIQVRQHGINYISSSVHSIECMGNKSNAIAIAREAGVKVVPGSHGVIADFGKALAVAQQVGYPILIKAAFGGGGKGMRIVEDEAEFEQAYLQTSQEAASAFGNGDVYLERYIQSMRHVEVQVLRDSKGIIKILGLRDCTVQRNHQKLLEESVSVGLPKAKIKEMYKATKSLVESVNYIGVGTVEFIYDIKANETYFMEMNTRLQVEHPVTEMVCNVDIVRNQIAIAEGETISKLKPVEEGYAIEVRINAELPNLEADGRITFQPSPGKITKLHLPEHSTIRVLKAFDAGYEVTPFYDSLLFQIIATGKDRESTIKGLSEYLAEIRLEGIYTNIPLMQSILNDEAFIEGKYDNSYLTDFFERTQMKPIIERTLAMNKGASGSATVEAIRIDGSDELRVISPNTGVFYSSPAPGEPPFVKSGQRFSAEDTLYILESMKVFSPVNLKRMNGHIGEDVFLDDNPYIIVRSFAESGQTVNRGDLLYIVKPA